jgi:hypothetical protein
MVRLSTALRTLRLESGLDAPFNTTGRLRYYSTSQPASADTAPPGVLLCDMSLPADAFGAAAAGVKAKAGTWAGTGAAARARAPRSAGSASASPRISARRTPPTSGSTAASGRRARR